MAHVLLKVVLLCIRNPATVTKNHSEKLKWLLVVQPSVDGQTQHKKIHLAEQPNEIRLLLVVSLDGMDR